MGEDKATLQALGLPLPSPNADRFALIRAPRGYGKAAAAPKKGEPPPYRYWPSSRLKMQRRVVKKTKTKRVEPENQRSFYSNEKRRMRKYGTALKKKKKK